MKTLKKIVNSKYFYGILWTIIIIAVWELFATIVNQLSEKEKVTEQLKAENQTEWIRRMNSIRNRALEIVNDELIYK